MSRRYYERLAELFSTLRLKKPSLQDDVFLGSVAISLDSLKPNEPNTQEYKLENIASGSVHLTLEYDPDTVWTKKKRKGTMLTCLIKK